MRPLDKNTFESQYQSYQASAVNVSKINPEKAIELMGQLLTWRLLWDIKDSLLELERAAIETEERDLKK